MKQPTRKYTLISACGLNCGLCPSYYTTGTSRCPGCGGENFFNPACAILKCNARHGGIEFCCECPQYPCERYDGAEMCDSFITHHNQLKDNAKLQTRGLAAYRDELCEKMIILRFLLDNHNDGRRKNFYCIAVNLLELDDVRYVMDRLANTTGAGTPLKEKVESAVHLFEAVAEARGVSLKLRRKPKTL